MFPFNFEIYFLLILASSGCGFNIAVDENLMRNITPPADATSSETSVAERSAGKFFGYQIQTVNRDGHIRSTDWTVLSDNADYARSLDILTFAIGVGAANISELQTIATGTATEERVYFASNFNALSEISGQLTTDISTVLEGRTL
ncbi:unnamed protein product [Clavelina lepadiformis]|uniref:VWFA domain-containing protein n=1 Tax=Clavelina lepadiformis TaxID=159417 RepID=A0ABP0F1J9_CLALP